MALSSGLSADVGGGPVIGDGVREIEWGAVVVCAVEVIEGRNGQESVVR